MPEDSSGFEVRIRLGALEKVVPLFEADQDGSWNRQKTFQHRHVMDYGLNVCCEPIGSLFRLGEIAVHACSDGNEVQVVAVVHARVNALNATCLNVGFIGASSGDIGLHRSVVVAGADVDVGWHVNDVSRRRRHCCQTIGPRQRAFRGGRSFYGMDVVMDRAQVIGIALDYRFQCGNDLVCARFGRSIMVP